MSAIPTRNPADLTTFLAALPAGDEENEIVLPARLCPSVNVRAGHLSKLLSSARRSRRVAQLSR